MIARLLARPWEPLAAAVLLAAVLGLELLALEAIEATVAGTTAALEDRRP